MLQVCGSTRLVLVNNLDYLSVCVIVSVCVCVGGGGGADGRADGRALVMTFGILYSVMRVKGSILVESTLSQFPSARNSPTLASLHSGV